MDDRLVPTLVGVAGQYFVAAELSRRGIIATVTLRNTRGIDVLAASADGKKAVNIQLKTNQDRNPLWVLSEKAETLVARDLFYVFVHLNGPNGSPSYYVVESRTVAKYATEFHRQWIGGTRRDGEPRKNTTMRKFADPGRRYHDAWDRLGLKPL